MTEPSVIVRKPELQIVDDAQALYRAAAQEFRGCANAAVAGRGQFSVALAGGNTPRGLYSLLAQENQADLPWAKTFVFFGDERYVPRDHPDSNYRMARETLLSRVAIPERNIFFVSTELPPEAAAEDYDRRMREFFHVGGGAWPRFDLILLGIGNDGHTASLFPGTGALGERSRFVVANWVDKFNSYRITFTLPVLNHAAEVLFLVSGNEKAHILKEIFSAQGSAKYPAKSVQPVDGRLLWLVDRSAAGLLAAKENPLPGQGGIS